MSPKLSTELEIAVQESHGTLCVQGDREAYVVMTLQAYREMAGVGSDAEFSESLRAVQEGLADIAAGRTRPYREVFAEIRQREDLLAC